jgi:NAD(P)-dependent dehydrogenase (short-subunit alcohol dehydrogenase family)
MASQTQGAEALDPRARGARRFEGKIAVVTGAGQGLGAAVARRLAQEGASLMLADMIEATAQRTCDQLTDFGAQAAIFVGDLSNPDNAKALMAKAKETYSRIDVMVTVVGGNIWWQSFQLYTPEQIIAEVNKNFWPNLWCTWAVLPYMIEQRSGAIVNVATHAVVGKFRVPYAASKGGLMAMTTAISKEVAHYGIRLNVAVPSGFSASDRVTPQNYGVTIPSTELPPEEVELQAKYREERRFEIPMGRNSTAEEQAAAIAFLASDDASFITGQILPVGGGQTYPF